MRILLLTNYYPPHEIGGYEQLCRDVALRFEARGHTIAVLTSDRGVLQGETLSEQGIHRLLRIQPRYDAALNPALQFFLTRRGCEAYNRSAFRLIAERFKPDVVFIWNLEGLPYELALEAESCPGAGVAYWLAHYSPAEPDSFWRYWTQPPGRRNALSWGKRLLARAALAQMRREGKPVRPVMRHAAVVSEWMLRKGLAEGTVPAHARVIHNGVELDQFIVERQPRNGLLRLLVAGRMSEDKGVHTALEGVHTIVDSRESPAIHLTIVGRGPDGYRQELLRIIADRELGTYVTMQGWIDRKAMPEIMAQADVLLLPSIHPEGLPRVVLEAMASGLAVVATPVGGTGEIVEHNITGLLFPPGDGDALAAQVQRLLDEAGLLKRLATEGQHRAITCFSLERMVDDVEVLLLEAAGDRDS